MPEIKIQELPVKTYPEVAPTDIMVIEDRDDTYQVTVEALKLMFSSDEKIKALTELLNEEIARIGQTIADLSSRISEKDKDLEAGLINLFNDHERTKMKLGKLQEDMIDVQNHIKEIDESIASMTSRIEEIEKELADDTARIEVLEKDNEQNKSDIAELQTDNEQNKTDIAQLQTGLSDLSKKLDEQVKRLDDRITKSNTDLSEYANLLYDRIMQYIDYYHHVHTNPPNFDEPYKGDPVVANYIHPIGTIYETMDPNFEINKWFPGTWKYMGEGAAFDKEHNRTVDYYTWLRVE